MPAGKFGSKFLGKERYQQYVDELTAEGTIGGKKLSNAERKDAFRKRNNRVGFESFVKNILERKESATESSEVKGLLPGTVGKDGALTFKKSKIDPKKLVPQVNDEEKKENNNDILKGIDSILESLREQQKIKKKAAIKDRRSKEREGRAKKEKKLESNVFKGLAKATDKIIAPVKSLFEKLFNFITTIFIGRVLKKLIEWFGDEENKRKLDAIGRFLGDTWPALMAAFLVFGTGLGGFLATIVGLATKFVPLLVKLTARLLAGMGKGALKLIGGVGIAASSVAALTGVGLLANEVLAPTSVADGTLDAQRDASGKLPEDEGFDKTTKGKYEPPIERKDGGIVPGSGPNKDTVSAMLSPGEFVMSRGAVKKYGSDTLESMNSMGGGTNRPMIRGGRTYANGGGMIDKKQTLPSDQQRDMKKRKEGKGNFFTNLFGGDKSREKANSGGGSIKGLTGQDFRDLAFIVSAEAQRGTDDEYGVSAAVLNRVADPAWPNTIKEVGSQAGQFAAVFDGHAYDDPELAKKLAAPEGQAKIVEAMKKLQGRTDFKGTSEYGNMGQGDIKFSNRGNFYHYKEQRGKSDPPPSPLPSHYAKFIGTGGPTVTLDGTSNSSMVASSDSGSGGSGSSSSVKKKPFNLSTMKSFDYMAARKSLGVKTDSVSKSSRPSSTEAYQKMSQRSKGNQQQMQSSGYSDVPNFAADAMISSEKISVLGISV